MLQKLDFVFYFIFFLVLFIACKGQTKNQSIDSKLKFNGYYVSSDESKHGVKFKKYLRFYQDKTVLGVSSSGKPSQIKSWFKKGSENLSVGTYTIKNDSLFFNLKSSYGEVIYKGKKTQNELLFFVDSKITNHQSFIKYKFLKLTLPN